jgi:hypothetical protein
MNEKQQDFLNRLSMLFNDTFDDKIDINQYCIEKEALADELNNNSFY